MGKKKNPDDDFPAEMTASDAARYLNVSTRTINHHATTTGKLVPCRQIRMGSKVISFFTSQALDQLEADLRPDGRPGKGRPRNSDED